MFTGSAFGHCDMLGDPSCLVQANRGQRCWQQASSQLAASLLHLSTATLASVALARARITSTGGFCFSHFTCMLVSPCQHCAVATEGKEGMADGCQHFSALQLLAASQRTDVGSVVSTRRCWFIADVGSVSIRFFHFVRRTVAVDRHLERPA